MRLPLVDIRKLIEAAVEINDDTLGVDALREGGPGDYSNVSTPVADAICDHVNLEIKVQPTSGETEMRQIAEAIRKIVSNRAELKAVDQGIQEGTIK